MTFSVAACGIVLSSTLLQLPDQPDADRAFARGREALLDGRYDEAAAAFEESLRARPEDARGWDLLARSRCREAERRFREAAGDADAEAGAGELMERAEQAARRSLDLDERSPQAWATLGHVLVWLGSADEAIATLLRAEKLAEPAPEALVDLAEAQLLARNFAIQIEDRGMAAARTSDAIATLERAVRAHDDLVDVLRRRGEILQGEGRPREALRDYRRAIQLRPADTELLEAHLRLVAATQEFDEAVDFYTGLVDEPALSRWYRSRARELNGHLKLNRDQDYVAAAEQYRLAEGDFRECARLDATLTEQVMAYLPTLRAFRGHALTLAEKFPEAEAALLSALDLDPRHENALRFLHALQDAMWSRFGGESMPREKFDEMRAFACKLATIEPDNADNWNNWGFFARDAGDYEESYLAYRRAIELAPDNARYLNDTAILLLYHLNRDLDRAQEWLERAIRLEPRDRDTLADAYGNLINLLQGTGRKEAAIARLRELEAKLPTRTEVDYWKKQLLPDEWQADQDRKAAEAAGAGTDDEAGDGSAEDRARR